MDVSNETISKIKWRLINDGATDLSDYEINRILKNTCSPRNLIIIAKKLRDNNLLNLNKDE